ncbi:3128_t:CDS:2, partial [Cetraspora pellucida]
PTISRERNPRNKERKDYNIEFLSKKSALPSPSSSSSSATRGSRKRKGVICSGSCPKHCKRKKINN